MPYITHGFLRADSRNSMGFILLYGKKNVSRCGFRHSVLEATRRPVCHVILQRCAGMDVLAFGLCACTKLDGMETTNTGDLSVYLAHSADYEQITVSTVPAKKTNNSSKAQLFPVNGKGCAPRHWPLAAWAAAAAPAR